MKGSEERKECKEWKWSRFRKSNIPDIHKKNLKNKDSIKPG